MQVLHQLPHIKDKDLLVGIDTSDDAAVYRISVDRAAVTSLDFFPPLVDDPDTFQSFCHGSCFLRSEAQAMMPSASSSAIRSSL